jgi:hypothetical protein
MLNAIRRLTERLARGRVLALLAVPTLALFAVFNFHPSAVPYLQQAGNGVPPLDIQLGYGPQDVRSLLTTYGAEGRQRYALFLAADIVFAVCYGLFLAGLLRFALRPPVARADSRWNDLCLLPLLAGAADCVENVSILVFLAVYPAVPPALAYLASAATLVKWSLAAAGIVAILVAFGLRLAAWRTGRTAAPPAVDSERSAP